MQGAAEEFKKRGVRMLAVSVDPPATTREHAEKQGYTAFTFLADEKMEIIRAWDFVHEGGNRRAGTDISRPAEFLLDPSGTIRWRNLTGSYRERLKAEEALKIIDEVRAADR